MSKLAYIQYSPWRGSQLNSEIAWEPDLAGKSIGNLPQIFWNDGRGWAEANHWALSKVLEHGVDLETVKSLMKHLQSYSNFLESSKLDWRHFPARIEERALVKFRGHLINQIESGHLKSSTASARMRAVVQFYRHAKELELIAPLLPMWSERNVVIPFFDATGFKRTLLRASTNLAIRNRARPGIRLEGGLLPLSENHMGELLSFTARQESVEIHLLLSLGFFTGARLETITTISIESLENAYPDPFTQGFHLLRVGPGTKVKTKFNVEGQLLMPNFLLAELLKYAYSTSRIKRGINSTSNDCDLLFLTTRGRRYSNNTVSRLMTNLRRTTLVGGLDYMKHFKFHETRATYGTWLMRLMLAITSAPVAIEFVKSAMFHKHESTTFGYIKFIESSKGKQEVADAFSEAFAGLTARDWNRFDA